MKPERLAWLALPLLFYREVKTWFWLLVIGGVSGVRGGFSWWQLLGIALALAWCIVGTGLRYWRFTYELTPEQVTINAGLFVKKVRHIPYASIQTLERQQWFFLQPFGLESVRIETASKDGANGEGTLLAVPLSVATTIEQYRHRVPAAAPVPQPSLATLEPSSVSSGPRYQINAHDLNLYALTSLGFLPLLAVVGAVWNKLDDWIPDDVQSAAADQLAHLAVIALVALAVTALLLTILASYLNLVQRYYHFTLSLDAHTLTATRGFFKRNTISVRQARIQAVRLRQSILRQWLRLTTVQAITASNAADDDAQNDLVLMPVIKSAQALPAMAPFVAWLPDGFPALTGVPTKNRWLYSRNILLGSLLVFLGPSVSLFIFARTWLWWLLIPASIWLLLAAWQGRYDARQTGVAVIDANRIAVQTGQFWTRSQYIIRRENVQSLVLARSLWMSRKHRVHIRLNIRRGDGNLCIELRYLDVTTAQMVQNWYQPNDQQKVFSFSEK